MRLNGPDREYETVRDLSVAQPLAGQIDELRLAPREVDRGGVEAVDRRQLGTLVGNVQLPGARRGAPSRVMPSLREERRGGVARGLDGVAERADRRHLLRRIHQRSAVARRLRGAVLGVGRHQA